MHRSPRRPLTALSVVLALFAGPALAEPPERIDWLERLVERVLGVVSEVGFRPTTINDREHGASETNPEATAGEISPWPSLADETPSGESTAQQGSGDGDGGENTPRWDPDG